MLTIDTVSLAIENFYNAYISVAALGRIGDVAKIEKLIKHIEKDELECDGLVTALRDLIKEIQTREELFKCLRESAGLNAKARSTNGGSSTE